MSYQQSHTIVFYCHDTITICGQLLVAYFEDIVLGLWLKANLSRHFVIAIWRISDVTALTDYWQSEYHFLDSRQSINNAFISFYGSFARRASADLVTVTTGQCLVTPVKVKEAHVIQQSDRFHGVLVKYEGAVKDGGRVTLETHALARRDYKVLDPTGPVGRLISIQVRLWSPDLLKKWVSCFSGFMGEWIRAWDKQIVWTTKRSLGDLFVPRSASFLMNLEKKILIPYIYNASNKVTF